ncbi:hypothetical protein PTKIN_Ptkin07bG0034000 [Pterospermum kingtungense]
MRPYASAYRVKIQTHSKLGLPAYVLRVLGTIGEQTVQEFRDTCFGALLDIDRETVVCGMMLHQVIARQITFDGISHSEAWFQIGTQRLRWSKTEFALMTGLKFGTSIFDPNVPVQQLHHPENGVWRRRFNGRPMCCDVLYDAFKRNEYNDRPADAVKIALVLFAELFLFGLDDRFPVRSWIWSLVCVPWGKFVFQCTLHYLHAITSPASPPLTAPTFGSGSKKKKAPKVLKLPKLRYHFYGFPIALQLWVFEAIFDIGSRFATRLTDVQNLIPRFRRWQMGRTTAKVGTSLVDHLRVRLRWILRPRRRQRDFGSISIMILGRAFNMCILSQLVMLALHLFAHLRRHKRTDALTKDLIAHPVTTDPSMRTAPPLIPQMTNDDFLIEEDEIIGSVRATQFTPLEPLGQSALESGHPSLERSDASARVSSPRTNAPIFTTVDEPSVGATPDSGLSIGDGLSALLRELPILVDSAVNRSLDARLYVAVDAAVDRAVDRVLGARLPDLIRTTTCEILHEVGHDSRTGVSSTQSSLEGAPFQAERGRGASFRAERRRGKSFRAGCRRGAPL